MNLTTLGVHSAMRPIFRCGELATFSLHVPKIRHEMTKVGETFGTSPAMSKTSRDAEVINFQQTNIGNSTFTNTKVWVLVDL